MFARVEVDDGGRFPLTGRGDVNTYALFAELFGTLTSKRGRAGVIVPTGIATDATTALFFGALLNQRRLVSLHDFQTGMGYFDRIGHARFKFCLLTVGSPGSGPERPAFSFFARTIREFQDGRRHFVLARDEIAKINPNTITAPIFRTSADAELTARIHGRVPVLINDAKGKDGNPWGVSFMRMFDMSNDSGLFRTAAQLAEAGLVREGRDWIAPDGIRPCQGALLLAGGHDDRSLALDTGPLAREPERYVPLYEAKMIHQFDHRWATYENGDSRDVTAIEKSDLRFEPTPRYWVAEGDVADRLAAKNWTLRWLIGWRDIARSTDERTLVSGLFPTSGCGDKFLLMSSKEPPEKRIALYASLNSLVCDYVARQKLGGTSFKYFTMKQITVLPPTFYSPADLAFIVPRVLELTYTSHAMALFARDLGYDGPPYSWDENRRAQLRAELDAFYARAYGLTRDELRYILDPADVKGADYPSETFRVLKSNEIRRFGEYRTAKLVLQAWDAMQRGDLAA